MWENVLKKPITIGSTKIGLKPMPDDENDCCEQARKAWIDVMIRMGFNRNSAGISFVKDLTCENLYDYFMDMSRPSSNMHEEGMKIIEEILEKWDECEQ